MDMMVHKDFNNFFNWTVTYHRASDFPNPYARFYPSGTTDHGVAWRTPLNLTYPMGNGKSLAFANFTDICGYYQDESCQLSQPIF